MTILTLTKTGAMRIPTELLKQIGNPRHLQVRVTSNGVTLSPVKIQPTMDRKAIPSTSGQKS